MFSRFPMITIELPSRAKVWNPENASSHPAFQTRVFHFLVSKNSFRDHRRKFLTMHFLPEEDYENEVDF